MRITAALVEKVDGPFTVVDLDLDEPGPGVVVVPRDLPIESLGPLACGLSTGAGAVLHTLRPGLGSSIVVYGVGSVGLAAIMAARSTAATRIIAVDRHAA